MALNKKGQIGFIILGVIALLLVIFGYLFFNKVILMIGSFWFKVAAIILIAVIIEAYTHLISKIIIEILNLIKILLVEIKSLF